MKKKLNLGCGVTHFSDAINIDIAADCNPDIVWDLEKGLPSQVKEQKFEQITIFESIEHIKNFQRLLRECNAVLKKNGKIIITTHNYRGLMHRIKAFIGDSSIFWNFKHLICFTDTILRKELENAGFKDVRILGNSISCKYLPYWLSGNIEAIAWKGLGKK